MSEVKWLSSFGRRKGRNFKIHQLLSLSSYEARDLKAGFHLEVGFGYGEHLITKAVSNPNLYYVGCEVYLNGISRLLKGIENNSINNIAIWPDDARNLLEQLPDNIIGKTYILFPDPWPKRKVNKRRLINNQLLLLLLSKVQVQSEIIIATDSFDYAGWIEKEIVNIGLKYEKPECMEIETRYKKKSNTPINWFQCYT